ncbi:MAG: anthranilate phosphoribosyltransferase [Candidatus Brockarchaeota archaeon]|nr:anthranilate phosphoribosyltransferase [Candidatus Brockarchaeota archaeon]
MIRECIAKLVRGEDLLPEEAEEAMTEIMSGKASDAQIASFITALRMKGETVEEITAFASVMRRFCIRINPSIKSRLIDTCGTGGDPVKTFNVSTIAALIAAGAGVYVAKHGNRSVTSKCGSADLLEALGFNLNMSPEAVEKSIESIGIGFMFAPVFHPAMKHAVGPRREIGIRTVFNILGPLTNPAGAKAQLLGVCEKHLLKLVANVLKNLGVEKAMVVYGSDGLDEISITGRTNVFLISDGRIVSKCIEPEDFGLKRADKSYVQVSSKDESVKAALDILRNRAEDDDRLVSKRNMALINAAAAIFLGGKAKNLSKALEIARESLESGAAYNKLKDLIKYSGGNLSVLEELEKNG